MKRFADCHMHIRGERKEEVFAMLDDAYSKGITDAALLALPSCYSISENLAVLYYKMCYSKIKVRAFGGLHLTDMFKNIPYETQVEKLLDLGCDGIKLYDMKPEIRYYNGRGIDNPAYDQMFSLMEERRTPVLIHANDPKEMWEQKDATHTDGLSIYRGCYIDKPYMGYREIKAECLSMLEKHPKLNVVFAHFFFLSPDLEEATRLMEQYPNLKVDLAPASDMYFHFAENISGWHDFFTKYSSRILFGTDLSAYKDFNKEIIDLVYSVLTHDDTEFQMPCYGNWMIRGLGLDPSTVENICYNSFEQFVSAECKPIDTNGFYSCADYILEKLEKNPKNEYYEEAAYLFTEYPDPYQVTAIDFLRTIINER